MFKTVDLLGINGPLKNGWIKLNRQIQTKVEHQRVFAAAVLVRGDVVCGIAGSNQVTTTDADASDTSEWCGVMAEPAGVGEQAVMRTSGYAYVHFITGLGALVEGVPVYLSAVKGRASTAVPAPTGFTSRLGILADATEYSDLNPFAWVVLGHCCPPTIIPDL